MKKYKKYVVVVAVALILFGMFSLAKTITEHGRSTEDLVGKQNEEIMAPKESTENAVISTVRGEALNAGSAEDKSIQCVYSFFDEYLPELGYTDVDCEIDKIDSETYCVYVGDWYIFVAYEYNMCYNKGYFKDCEFTDYEKEALSEKIPNVTFEQDDEGNYLLGGV